MSAAKVAALKNGDDTAVQKALIKRFLISTTSDSRAFSEADVDGNQLLDFDEFLALQPAEVRDKHSVESIREWFDTADADGSGSLSVNEFFAWSLTNASALHGTTALQMVFERYDTDMSGRLDAIEFDKACADLGFGAVSNIMWAAALSNPPHAPRGRVCVWDVTDPKRCATCFANCDHRRFRTLDTDGSGTVCYGELIDALLYGSKRADAETKVMLTAFVCTLSQSRDKAQQSVYDNNELRGGGQAQGSRIDTTTWRIHAKDAAGVRTELQTLLRQSGGYVADLMRCVRPL